MAAFLKTDTSTTPPSMKMASGADYDYAVNQILTTFASSSTGVGTLSVNPVSTTGLTSIGTFTDTYYNSDAGDHPIGTSVSTATYTFYQDLQSATESLTRPVEFSSSSFQEQTDVSLNADLISTSLSNLVSIGVGSYQLSSSTPTGGTWTNIATITNTLDTNETNVTYLWRKTAPDTAPSTIRPVKINPTTPVSVKEMSDAEIQTLTERLRNRIVATGIGTYAIQSAAPVSGGTWVTAGIQVIDTTRTISDISYSGTYVGSYLGAYQGTYAGFATSAFSGSYSGGYTGSYTGTYAGAYVGAYTGAYVRTRAQTFLGYYVRVTRSGGYVGTYRGTRFFNTSQSPQQNYNGTYNGFYETAFQRENTQYYTGYYEGQYSGSYAGTRNKAFTGTYTGSYTGAYTGNRPENYTGAYEGSYEGSYIGAYAGLTLNNDSTNISDVYLWIRTL